jgi:hypothetical protein
MSCRLPSRFRETMSPTLSKVRLAALGLAALVCPPDRVNGADSLADKMRLPFSSGQVAAGKGILIEKSESPELVPSSPGSLDKVNGHLEDALAQIVLRDKAKTKVTGILERIPDQLQAAARKRVSVDIDPKLDKEIEKVIRKVISNCQKLSPNDQKIFLKENLLKPMDELLKIVKQDGRDRNLSKEALAELKVRMRLAEAVIGSAAFTQENQALASSELMIRRVSYRQQFDVAPGRDSTLKEK